MSNNMIRPSESVIAAKVPLGDKVSFSPFLGWSFKHVRGKAVHFLTHNLTAIIKKLGGVWMFGLKVSCDIG